MLSTYAFTRPYFSVLIFFLFHDKKRCEKRDGSPIKYSLGSSFTLSIWWAFSGLIFFSTPFSFHKHIHQKTFLLDRITKDFFVFWAKPIHSCQYKCNFVSGEHFCCMTAGKVSCLISLRLWLSFRLQTNFVLYPSISLEGLDTLFLFCIKECLKAYLLYSEGRMDISCSR